MILTAFIAAQRGVLDPKNRLYLWLNLLGAGTLAVVAAIDSDWGFLLLEAVWAGVSAHALLTLGRAPAARA
jgi:hypothetical protein